MVTPEIEPGTSTQRSPGGADNHFPWQDRQHITVDREPNAVPKARQLISSCFPLHPDSAFDAELVVSELVTNAVLHGSAPIDVYLLSSDQTVRVEVHDAGHTPPILASPNPESMTGRGLGMVAALSTRWGVDRGEQGGKVVWAELSAEVTEHAGTAPGPASSVGAGTPHDGIDIAALLASWEDDEPEETIYAVSLGPVATGLLASAKAHLDNVARELVLISEGQGTDGDGPLSPEELTDTIDVISRRFGTARLELKREAAAAIAKGEMFTHAVLHLPASAAEAGEQYLEALDRIDRYARSAQILTLASPPEDRLFREWYVNSLVEQLRALRQGEVPPPPEPFHAVLAREVARLTPLQHVSARLALLRRVTLALSNLDDPRAMAEVVVEGAMELPEVETARVRLLDADDMLQSVAWRGRGAEQSEPVPAYSLHSDLFGAQAVRTGQPLVIRSLAESFRQRPDIMAFYNKDLSVRIVPLISGDQRFGLLSLTFRVGTLEDEDEIALVSSLAGELSQALARAELAARERQRRETLDFLAEASQIMTSAREPAQVLQAFASLAVPRLGDWCTVYVPNESRSALVRAAVAIEGHRDLARELEGTSLDLATDLPQARTFLTGQAEAPHNNSGAFLERLYPGLDFDRGGLPVEPSSGMCVPVVLRGEVVGVIGLTFLVGRRIPTAATQEALVGLADRAAVALDNARNWAAREQLVQSLVTALLPASPPVVRGLQFASRYLPAEGSVAGDWWEVDELADGSVLIGLGDAAGHGVPAVSQMLELRHGARALASVERSPAALLADLNRRLGTADAGIATAFYGRLTPSTGALTWASAGHLPPVIISADEQPLLLGPGGGTVLGAPVQRAADDHDYVLRMGQTLILYSDGAVERRHDDLEGGIARLVATAQAHGHGDLDALADALVAEHCARGDDDCCLLLVRRVGQSA